MRALALTAALVLTGCYGEAGVAVEPDVIAFQSSLRVSPDAPVRGKRVDLSLDLTSASNITLKSTVHIAVRGDEGLIYEYQWSDILIHPREGWNLSQGFLPSTDVKLTPHTIAIEVRSQETGELLYENPAIAKISFK